MFKLLKSESSYFIILLSVLSVLPIAFAVYSSLNIELTENPNTPFINKYFWSIFIGLGTYSIYFIIWGIREKEKRDRLHVLIPRTLKSVSFSRWLFGSLPLIYILLCLILLYEIHSQSQKILIIRILAQLGLFFMFLAPYELIHYVDRNMSQKYLKYNYHIKVLSALVLVLILLAIIYLATIFLKELYAELLFNISGITVFALSNYLYSRRKIFT